jgi:polyisoprenoid-binding protein YceI
MNRTVAIAAVALVVIGAGAAVWVFGQGTETPTVGATAPPVETTTPSTTGTTDTTLEEQDPVENDGAVTYAMTEASRAMFIIDEELRGQPNTVVGTSTIVLGEMVLDPDDPTTLRIGTVLVNARDFATDSGTRDSVMRGRILDTDTFEFIEFVPTAVDGFDGSAGNEVMFTITGDLTIRDVTNPVMFAVTAVLAADDTISGTAEATVDRTDWGLNIPNAPAVANVSETVILRLEFVAAPTA